MSGVIISELTEGPKSDWSKTDSQPRGPKPAHPSDDNAGPVWRELKVENIVRPSKANGIFVQGLTPGRSGATYLFDRRHTVCSRGLEPISLRLERSPGWVHVDGCIPR